MQDVETADAVARAGQGREMDGDGEVDCPLGYVDVLLLPSCRASFLLIFREVMRSEPLVLGLLIDARAPLFLGDHSLISHHNTHRPPTGGVAEKSTVAGRHKTHQAAKDNNFKISTFAAASVG